MTNNKKTAEDITPTDSKRLCAYWEELECILDDLSYFDLPKDNQPENYDDLMEEALYEHLIKAIDILKELGI